MAGSRSNREILTGGKKYHTKQAKKFGVDEVVFDKDSRKEYLTGFHKRKLQRQKKAQEYIKEQERLARVEERRQLREERKKDLENQMKGFKETVERITKLGSDDEEDEEEDDGNWSGFGSDGEDEDEDEDSVKPILKQPKGILHHQEIYTRDNSEYLPESGAIIEDETTVTIESLDNPIIKDVQEANLEAIARANNVNLNKSEDVLNDSIKRAKNYAVVCGVAKPSAKDQIKKKKKKFRYLTKTERRENNRKIKASKLKSRSRD